MSWVGGRPRSCKAWGAKPMIIAQLLDLPRICRVLSLPSTANGFSRWPAALSNSSSATASFTGSGQISWRGASGSSISSSSSTSSTRSKLRLSASTSSSDCSSCAAAMSSSATKRNDRSTATGTSTGPRQRWQVRGSTASAFRCSQISGCTWPGIAQFAGGRPGDRRFGAAPLGFGHQARVLLHRLLGRSAPRLPRQSPSRPGGAPRTLCSCGQCKRIGPCPRPPFLPEHRPLVLGSTSLYRRELLSRLHLPFQVALPGRRRDAARPASRRSRWPRAAGAGQGARGGRAVSAGRRDRLGPGGRPGWRAAGQAGHA